MVKATAGRSTYIPPKAGLAILLGLLTPPAAAATFNLQPLDIDAALIVIDGRIEAGDAQKFEAVIGPYSKGAVLFRSLGGSLMDGIMIGEAIRMKAFHTGVAPDTMCASACALAWLGGTQRYMSKDARLGFHLAYTLDGDGTARETGWGNAMMGAYLTRLGLPTRAVAYIASASPQDMTWLTADDADLVGIVVTLLDVGEDVADGHAAASDGASQTAAHFVTGLDPNGDNWLALKAGPDGKSKRLLKMGPGTRLHVLGRSGKWLQVQLDDGTSGWAFSKYVSCCTN